LFKLLKARPEITNNSMVAKNESSLTLINIQLPKQ